MRKSLLIFAILYMVFCFSSVAQVGKEFWFVAPDVTKHHGDEPCIFRFTALDKDARVVVDMPAYSAYGSKVLNIKAGTMESLGIDKDILENKPSDKINNKGVRIISDEDITVYYEVIGNSESNSSWLGVNPDKFTLKGENALGKEFFIPSQNAIPNAKRQNGDVTKGNLTDFATEKVNIVATEDNTVVTIVPTHKILGDHKANVPYNIVLNQGQTYCMELRDRSSSVSLAGSYISSDKNITVTISDDSVIPYGTGANDLIGDQIIPTDVIGTEYIVMEPRGNKYVAKVFVLATQDNTVVTHQKVVGGKLVPYTSRVLKKGEQIEIDIPVKYVYEYGWVEDWVLDASRRWELKKVWKKKLVYKDGIDAWKSLYIKSSKPVYAYHLTGLGGEMGSAILPPINCTGSKKVTIKRIFDKACYVQLLTQKKNIENFSIKSTKGTVYNYLDKSRLSWSVVDGTAHLGDDAWSVASVNLNKLATTGSYVIENTTGLFHLSIVDQSGGSVSYGYYSSYGELNISGLDWKCDGENVLLKTEKPMKNYRWYSDKTGSTILSTARELEVDETATYKVIAEMEFGGCEQSASRRVDFHLPEFNLGADTIVCPGDIIDLEVKDGLGVYDWNGEGSTNELSVEAPKVGSKTVQLTVVDKFNCTNTDTKIIKASDLPVIALSPKEICFGGRITAAPGAKKYEWKDPDGKVINKHDKQKYIEPKINGKYTLTVWNDIGCSVSETFEVIVHNPSFDIEDVIGCKGINRINGPVGDGLTYTWSTGSTLPYIEVDVASDYSLEVTDKFGCKANDDFNLSFHKDVDFSIGSDITECAGVTITFDGGSENTDYTWQFQEDEGTTFTDLAKPVPDEHVLELKDVKVVNSGKYRVTALNEFGCQVKDEVDVDIYEIKQPIITSSDILCAEGTISLEAAKGYDKYRWAKKGVEMGTTNHIDISEGGTYQLEVYKKSCLATTDIKIKKHALPTVRVSDEFTICKDTKGTLKVIDFSSPEGNALDYLRWNTSALKYATVGEADIEITKVGYDPERFTVTAVDEYGCEATDNVVVSAYPLTDIGLLDEYAFCEGANISLNNPIATAKSYQWFKVEAGGDKAATPNLPWSVTEAGTYRLEIMDLNNCAASDITVVKEIPLPRFTFGPDVKACANELVELTVPSGMTTYLWNPTGSTTNKATITAPTTPGTSQLVTITVADDYGCEYTATKNVNSLPLPTISLTKTEICRGEKISNNTEADKYKWVYMDGTTEVVLNTLETQDFIIPEKTGNYKLSIWKDNSCEVTKVFDVTVNELPDFDIVDQFGCKVLRTDGKPVPKRLDSPLTGTGFKYEWSDKTTKQYVWAVGNEDGSPKEYTLTVTDDKGCKATDDFKFSYYPEVKVDLGPDRDECVGISLEIDEETKLTDFEWSFQKEGTTGFVVQPTPTPENEYVIVDSKLENSGLYKVEAIDENKCKVKDEVKVKFWKVNPPKLELSEDLCDGEEISIEASSVYTSYKWTFDGKNRPETGNKLENIKEPGLYIVNATYDDGTTTCTKTSEITVELHTLPEVTISAPAPPNFCKDEAVELGVNFKKGSGEFNYLTWSNSINQYKDLKKAAITVDKADVYTVTAYDKFGCSAEDKVTVDQFAETEIGLDKVQPFCSGSTTTLENPLDASKYNNYKWSKIQNVGPDVELIEKDKWETGEAGDYRLWVEDKNGCEVADTISVNKLPLPEISIGPDTAICIGDYIELKLNTPAGFKSTEWQVNGVVNTTEKTDPIKFGETQNLLLTVTDANTCSNSDDRKISALAVPKIDVKKRTVCLGDRVTDNSGASRYKWEFKGVVLNSDETQNFIEPKESGDYKLTIWNDNNCSDTETITVTVNMLPKIDTGDRQSCVGEIITFLSAPVGFTYVYKDGDGNVLPSLDITDEGNYSLEITDANGCTNSGDFVYVHYKDVPINLGPDRNECLGINFDIDGGTDRSDFAWSFQKEGETTFTDLGLLPTDQKVTVTNATFDNAGVYRVRARNVHGCLVTDDVKVSIYEVESPGLIASDNLCSGSSITIETSKNYDSYEWRRDGVLETKTDYQLSVTEGGNYTLNARLDGCLITNSIKVEKHQSPKITAGTDISICPKGGGTIHVVDYSSDDGSKFDYLTWSVSERQYPDWNKANLKVNKPGLYTVIAYDEFGCSSTDKVNVDEYALATIGLPEVQSTCSDKPLTLSNPTTYTDYKWFKIESDGDKPGPVKTTWTVDETGTYRIELTDGNGCVNTDTTVVKVLPIPEFDLGPDKEMCDGESLTISLDKSFVAYRWNDDASLNTSTLNVSTSGDYKLEVQNDVGCWASDIIHIDVNPLPSFSLPGNTICPGEEVPLSVPTHIRDFIWSTGDTERDIKVGIGTYTLKTTSDKGCVGQATAEVKSFPVPTITLGADTMICPVDRIEITASPGFAYYEWHNGVEGADERSIMSNFSDTINLVRVRDFNGCWTYDSKQVFQRMEPDFNVSNDTIVCQDISIEYDIDKVNPELSLVKYLWQDGSTEPLYKVTKEGEYNIKVFDGCFRLEDKFNVSYYDSPIIAKLDTIIYGQIGIQADGGKAPYEFALNNEDWQTDNLYKGLETGDYLVQVKDANACEVSKLISLTADINIEVPNYVTPNNDGINDRWEPKGLDKFPDSEIKIYDRFGKLLAKYKVSEPGWNGEYLNKPVPSDAYWYVIEVLPLHKYLKGHITLKR